LVRLASKAVSAVAAATTLLVMVALVVPVEKEAMAVLLVSRCLNQATLQLML
jgi:hypothetical protein